VTNAAPPLSRLRRLLGVMRRLGIDIAPWLEGQRARMNRPMAARIEAEVAVLRRAQQEESERIHVALDTMRAAVEAGRDASDAPHAGRFAAVEAMLAAHAAALDGLAAERTRSAEALGRIARLEQQAAAQDVVAMALARQALAKPPEIGRDAETVPAISVIMAVRDRADIVAHAIRSVQAQDGVAWELVIVDDGSSDGTVAAIEAMLTDPRISLLRQPRAGAPAARNAGLAAARAPLIAYLDSDNAMLAGFLAGTAAAFADDPTLEAGYGLLVAEEAHHAASALLWHPFERATLAEGNFIDINTYVHRRGLIEYGGGFDETLTRLADWDMVLRHSAIANVQRLPLPAVAYRTRRSDRISRTEPFGPNLFKIRRKQQRAAMPPRVLYALWHYPQITESYIETEIRAMQSLGVTIEVWSQSDVAAAYPPAARLHRGSLADAITAFGPDLVHVHWLAQALEYAPVIAAAGLPMTVRGHGFEVGSEAVAAHLHLPHLARLYLFPNMLTETDPDPRIRRVPAAFDPELFLPAAAGAKNPRLVLRTAAALACKDLGLFFELAARLPEHRFVLVAGTCRLHEYVPAELRAMNAALGGHAEILVDVQRDEVAALMAEAGIYLHTALPPGRPDATPIGSPVSIVEAMATGALVLVRDLPPLAACVGAAGRVYRDIDHAETLIRESTGWDAAQWRAAQTAATDRAWSHHAGEVALAPIHADWCAIAAARRAPGLPASALRLHA
jgi:hypothetical protein